MFTAPPYPSFQDADVESSDDEETVDGSPDQFGWIKYADGDFFNVLTKERSNRDFFTSNGFLTLFNHINIIEICIYTKLSFPPMHFVNVHPI
jgi:hypothetical protein